uniref:Uncharacterized protein n=1 Tax=uncultured marine virus TaxID=186617 RepID=A0A0F7L3I7_9VIRU|nr:hypothetical protein [uncultured marine virus]
MPTPTRAVPYFLAPSVAGAVAAAAFFSSFDSALTVLRASAAVRPSMLPNFLVRSRMSAR